MKLQFLQVTFSLVIAVAGGGVGRWEQGFMGRLEGCSVEFLCGNKDLLM